MHLLELGIDILEIILKEACGWDKPSTTLIYKQRIQELDWKEKKWRTKTKCTSTLKNYLLVCRAFKEALLRDYYRYLQDELRWPIERMPPLMCIDLFLRLRRTLQNFSKSEPRPWVQITSKTLRSYRPPIFSGSNTLVRWTSVRCHNALERWLVKQFCDCLGLFHQTYRITETTADQSYHRKFDGYSPETACPGCPHCRKYYSRKGGVVISDKRIVIYADAREYIREMRKAYAQLWV